MGGPSENPELWAFLESLHRGEILSGTVTAIEPFGVFVALDDGPDHPVFPGVGLITISELSWRHIEAASDVVQIGQRVSCEFLQFDTWNLEAKLSLRVMRPDPFHAFADRNAVGRKLHGQVTKLLPFGIFVQTVPPRERSAAPARCREVPAPTGAPIRPQHSPPRHAFNLSARIREGRPGPGAGKSTPWPVRQRLARG